jgi:hypothetical protein
MMPGWVVGSLIGSEKGAGDNRRKSTDVHEARPPPGSGVARRRVLALTP